MKQKSRIPTLIMIVISVGMLILMILLPPRNVFLVIHISFLAAIPFCLYLQRFTSLSSKRWLKWVDKAIRWCVFISALLLLVLFVIYDWPAV